MYLLLCSHSHIILNSFKTLKVAVHPGCGRSERVNIKVPLSVSGIGLAAVGTLAQGGCKKFFKGWMEEFGNPYEFLRSPNIREKSKLQNPTNQ
jgi:hypothetical protein